MKAKRTTASFIDEAKLVHGTKYDYSKANYVTRKTKTTIICPIHGDFQQEPGSHLIGYGCAACGRASRKDTTESFIAKAKAKHGDTYDYSKVVYGQNQKDKVKIICRKHGIFEQEPNNHIMGGGCPKCHLLTTDEFVTRAKKIHGDRYDYSECVYKGAFSKVSIICKEHGKFTQRPGSHLEGVGCVKCSHNIRRLKHFEFLERATTIHKDKYTYPYIEKEYHSYSGKITVKCPKHGMFTQTVRDHLCSKGCSKCSHHKSSGEEEIKSLLDSLGVVYNRNFRKLIGPKEVDFYIPSANIAIEFNGSIWHSEKYKKCKNYHKNKTIDCAKKGVQLIHINEYLWNEKKELFKSLIKAKLKKLDRRIFARKCEVQEISSATLKELSEAFHLQGHVNASYRLALVHDGQIVMVTSFAKPRFSKTHQFELLRLFTTGDFAVIGGASKLLKHFERHISSVAKGPVKLVSYARKDWSTGEVYTKLNFQQVSISPPNYVWIRGKHYYTRYQTQKHRLRKLLGKEDFDPKKSEVANLKTNKFFRIFDSGNLVFEKELNL